jgi:hypothetical protein
MPKIDTFIKVPVVAGAATLLMGAIGDSDALFASDAQVFKAVDQFGGAWRSRPTLIDIPRPRPPAFMPYRFDRARSVYLHRNGEGQLNRVVLSDLGCWAGDRERTLRIVLRISGASPEALHNLRFAASNVFDGGAKLQGVRAAPRLLIEFQRSTEKSRCGINIVRTANASI